MRGEEDVVAKELFFRRSVRKGDMKAVYQPTYFRMFGPLTKPGETKWQLYDLAADPGETHDLAAERPDVLKGPAAQWHAYAGRNNVIVPAVEEKPGDIGLTR